MTGPAIPVVTYPEENIKEETAAGEDPVGLIVLYREAEETAPEGTDAEAETAGPETAGPRTLSTRVGEYTIVATGNIPENAEIRVVEIPADAAEKMAGKKTLFAYDVQLIVDGKVWQPEEHGEEVQISIRDGNGELNSDHIGVLHVKTDLVNDDGSLSEEALAETIDALREDNIPSEVISTSAKEGVVSFTTKSLSPLLGAEKATLQAMIDDALIAVSGTLTGRLEVALKKDMTYEGDIKIQVGDRSVADDFELELRAEDAGDDGMSGSGTTIVNGNITIFGIKVLMNSIMMAAKKVITVQNRSDSTNEANRSLGGELVFNASKNTPNEAGFVVGSKSSAAITSSDDDDVFTIETKQGAKSVTVSTGDGVDTVNATLSGGKADISTGDGVDRVNVNIAGNIDELRVDAGDGMDEINVIDNGSAKNGMTVNAGAGDDTISVDVRDNAGSMTVDTGDGGDEVTVTKGDHYNLYSVDYDQYNTNQESPNAATEAKLTIAGADRSDRVTIDASAALAIKGVDVTGGGASVHLKGELAAIENPITWIDANDHSKGFRLHTQLASEATKNDYTLDVGLGNNNFTDSLINKRRVELYASGERFIYDSADQDFTDYVFKTPVSGLRTIIFSRPNSVTADGLLLSNVVLDADETRDAGDTIHVHDLAAAHMNVLVRGTTIHFDGTVRAKNVRAESIQGTQRLGKTFADFFTDGYDVGDLVSNLINIQDAATINVNKDADIFSAGDIALVARVKHTGGMLTVLPAWVNLLNIKLADAKINVNSGAKLLAGGNVTLEARIQTSTGYEYDDTKKQEKAVEDGMPLAVNVIVNEAAVKVAKGASIIASADVVMEAKSSIKAATYATSSTIPSPADIAVTVIDNEAKVDVYGYVAAGRRVVASAVGSVKDENVATGASDLYGFGLAGAYFAVNVVNQDVNAIIHDGAVVAARGDVRVATQALADVTTSAVSSPAQIADEQVSIAGGFANISKALGQAAWKKMKGWFDNDKKKQERIEKLLKSISKSDYSVKLIKTSSENDEKGSATVTTKTRSNGEVAVIVDPQPRSGCRVKYVRYRYLEPGRDKYTYGDAVINMDDEDHQTDSWGFIMPNADVEVIVIYDGEPDGQDGDAPQQQKQQKNEEDDDDFINIFSLFNDSQDLAGKNAEEDDELFELDGDQFEVHTNYKLAFDDMEHGAVLTWLTGEDDRSLKEIYASEKLLLVVNPAQETKRTGDVVKYKLKEGGLSVIYTAEKDGRTFIKKDVVLPDKQGRFVYTIPEGLPQNTILTVHADFEPASDDAEASVNHNQVVGALAVGVLTNDGHALIETGSKVNAGGIVDMQGFETNRNITTADGTPVQEGAAKKKAEDKPTPIVKTSFGTGGAEFAVRMNSNVDGAVTGTVDKKEEANASAYHPVFTLSEADAAGVDRILISYYSKMDTDVIAGYGTRRTVTILRNADGSYSQEDGGPFDAFKVEKKDGKEIITANLTGLAIRNGTTADVSFIFNDEAAGAAQSGSQEYLIPNPIQVSYNALKNKDKSEISMGTVAYDGNHSTIGKYYFRVQPNRDAGYTIDAYDAGSQTGASSNKAALYASWTDASGKVQKTALKRDDTCAENVWFFQPTGGNYAIPDGAVITVNAVFREDLRKVKTSDSFDPKKAHGTVSMSVSEAKRGDEVELTLTAADGYAADKVQVSWFEPGSASWKTAEKSVDPATGKITFTMPETSDADTSYIRITPVFTEKTITIKKSEDIAVSEKDGKAWPGAQITVSPSEDKLKEGYKVTEVTLTYNGQQHVFAEGDKVTVPKELAAGEVEITAKLEPRIVRVADSLRENGSLAPVSGYADPGDKVYVKVEPDDGYRLKSGTLKAEIYTGAAGTQLVLKKDKGGWYFTMPSDADTNTVVTLVGEFEPGSEGLDNSVGAAAAIGVLNADNEVEIKGGIVSAAGGYSMAALTVGGKAHTVAKAGYSKADMGVAGALAVQVGSVDTSLAIRKDENGSITLDKGAVFMLAKGKHEYKTVGDAKGEKAAAEAGKTGVGAGIAVAVDSLNVTGVIEDGVKLVHYTAADNTKKIPTVTGITMNIGQKHKDEVTAKAGAAGGSAYVPVAAVDVYNADVLARQGKLDLSKLQETIRNKTDRTADDELILQGILPVAGKVKLKASDASAKAEYNHMVTADASARGGATAIGGAFIVTWIADQARAILNQSISADKAVSVTASSDNSLKATATAAVSGGVEGKKDGKSGKGGPDKQADGLLGGAGGIAGKYGKQDGSKIQNDAKGRQQAETAENTLTGAGAFVLNIQKNISRAEIMDRVDLITRDKLEVKSQNRTDATIRADSSATKSDTGVGIGIAINIVKMDNIARIGSGYTEARELELAAEIAKAPAKMGTRTVQQNTSSLRTAMQKEIAEAITGLIPEKYTKLAGVEITTKVVSKFAGTFTAKLFEDMGLDKLIALSGGESVDQGFVNAGKVIVERLKKFPMSLVAPLATVFSEAVETGESMQNAEWWETLLEDVLKTVTMEYAGDGWQALRKEILGQGTDVILGSAMDMVTGKFSGKGWDASTLKTNMKEAFARAMGGFVDQMIETTINKLGDRIPLLTQANVERVKELKKALREKTMEQLRGDLWTDITKTFREQVYDYEKYLIKYADGDFVTNAKNELKACLKESTVVMTNEFLDQLAGQLDVRFEKEPKTDRHIISTQAISGAGAKMNSGAGSLAISVANLTTTAEIADSASGVNITGDGMLSVKASELRRIRTHATASVDARGEADNDLGAGKTEDSETGGGAAARKTATYQDKVTVTTGVGGSAHFETGDTEDDLMVMLDVEEGYTLKEGDEIPISFKDKGSEDEDQAKAVILKRGDSFYIEPMKEIKDFDKSYQNADIKDLLINIEVEFDEVLHKVVKPGIKDAAGAKDLDASALSVSVEGREEKDGGTTARVGEVVRLKVDRNKNEGSKVKGVEVTYKDAKGVQHTETLDTAVVQLSANKDEIVYGFAMPNCDIGSITVIYEEGEDDRASDTESEDANGRSIGVGAAVAFAYGGSDVKAWIGKREEGVTAGTVAVRASVEHGQENFSTAGTDPFEGTNTDKDSEKDTGLDAAVSVFIVDNDVKAGIAGGTNVTTTAKNDAELKPSFSVNAANDGDDDKTEAVEVTSGAVVVQASESGRTETKASAFATGSNTAVGASVAVNVAISDIKAEVGGRVNASGAVKVKADSASADETWSMATAMGADVQRNLNKFADKVDATEESAHDLTTGKTFDEKAKDQKEKDKSNDTSKRITGRLNDDRVKSKDGDDASENLNVSTNVMRSQGSKLEAGEDGNKAAGDAGDQVNKQSGRDDVNAQQDKNETKKLQVAATVGVTVALHTAAVTVSDDIAADGDVALDAVNAGNFRTRSTAAAMTTEKAAGKTIAAAVGVSVNNNKATVKMSGSIAAAGDVELASNLTQNIDEPYVGLLAVQSIGGSVSGKGSEASIAGAAGILVSHATATSQFTGRTLEGGAVSITANDKSKLGVRAGGINVSKGANVGMGISAATIWSGNTVEATVADGAQITADDFSLSAAKQAVTWDDYKFPLTMKDVFTDSSKLSDEERENVRTGLIDIHRKPGETSYTVDVNLNTYALMKAFDALNGLSAVNYYTEAIAGSVVSGENGGTNKPGAFNGAGSFSLVRISNSVKAALGTGVTVARRGDSAGGVSIIADDATTARMLGGAVSGGKAKKSAGVTVTFLSDEDEAVTTIGGGTSITGAGDVTIASRGDTQAEAYNAAASVNTADQDASFTVGGGINVLLLKNKAKTNIGSLVNLRAGGRLEVTAGADMDLKLVSVGVAGARKAVAAGGTAAYIDDQAESTVNIGSNHTLKAQDDVSISAKTTDHLISVLASASAALETGKTSAAGAINLLQSRAKGKVTLGAGGAGNGVTSEQGSVTIEGVADSRAVNVTASAAGSKGKAIGLSVNANLFRRESVVEIAGGEGYAVSAAKDILIQTYGNDTTVMAGLAMAGSTGGNTLGGNLPLVSSKNTVKTTLGRGSFTAVGEAAISSHLKDRTYVIAGSIALSGAGSAAGGTALMAFKENNVKTDLGTSTVAAHGNNGSLAGRVAGSPSFSGLYVGATVDNTTVTGAAGAALAGKKGVTANVVALSSENTVTADASRAKLEALADDDWKVDRVYVTYNPVGSGYKYSLWTSIASLQQYIEQMKAGELNYVRYQLDGVSYTLTANSDLSLTNLRKNPGGSVTVKAANDVYNAVFAGGLNFGLSMGIGASVVVLSANNNVTAKAHDIDARQDVDVIADNREKNLLLNVNAGGSGKTAVELGVTVADLGNRVNAIVASEVKARGGSFSLKANNTTNLTNAAVALAGAGKTAGSPVFVYTGFTGQTNAVLEKGTVAARNGASITANSEKDIDQYTIGAAFSGKTALSGAVSVVSVKDQTNAQTLAGSDVTASRLDITAGSDYKLAGASAAVAASGQNAAAVNGMVTVIKAATLAELGGDAAASGDAVNVNAHSKRDVINVAATVAASGQNAAGITVMALVAGDKLSQDAADQLTYGSGGKGNGTQAFNASAMVETLEEMGIDTASMKEQKDENGNVTRTGLADDLMGDGENMDTRVGSNGGFDASSGYTSDDLYKGGTGENATAEETGDIQNAKNIGASARKADPLDSVTARISGGVKVNALGVNVEASQETLADLFGASVGASGQLGGGLSFAIAQLRSNVVAASLGDISANGKDVSVNAISRSGEVTVTEGSGSDEELRMAGTIKALGDKLNPTKRSIRAISIAAGAGGAVGAGIAAGAVRTDNVTSATLGGTVTEAGNVTVNSDHKYQNVLAATVGLAGGGQAGIAASIAGVGAYGTVSSKLDGGARVSGANPRVNVTTDSVVNADTVALTAAVGGGAGVAAGISFVRNQLTQNTTVERGTSIVNTGASNGGSLTVKGKSVTTGGGLLMGLSGGTGAVGIGVGVVNVKPTVNTSLGVNGSGTTTIEKLGSVAVLNDTSSKASASVLSVSAGAAAVSANVLLTFNDTDAAARAANITGSMNSFTIDGQLDASGNSDVLALTGGLGAAGVNINYVDVNSSNTAELDAANFNPVIAERLSVTAGDAKGKRITSAMTQSITGTAGLVAVGVNVSIARNRAVNDAVINGRDLNAADVVLGSYGKGVAKAEMGGASVGAVKITASVVDALNETTNRARMNLTGRLNGSLKAESKVSGETDVKMITGGGSIVGIAANVATAYGRTSAVTDVVIGGAADGKQSIVASADGRDDVTVDIDNLIGLNAISVAAMVGAAHAQDVYSARVKLANGDYNLSGVSVSTNSNINAASNVTPSSAGISLSLGSLGVNVSSATSTAYAGAELALENAKLAAEKDVDVRTATASRVNGTVRPATFSWGLVIDVGVNDVSSELKGTQAATLRLNNSQVAADGVKVQSIVNAADSRATVSTSGESDENKEKGNRVKLGVISSETNTAEAKERLASTAAIVGEGGTERTMTDTYYDMYYRNSGAFYRRVTEKEYANFNGAVKMAYRFNKVLVSTPFGKSYEKNRIDANTLDILAGTPESGVTTNAEAFTQGAFQLGLVTLGNLEGEAYAGESINTLLSGVVANVNGAAKITARGNVKARASGTMPGSLSAVDGGESTTTAGVGTESFRQTVKSLIGEDAELHAGAITLEALNSSNAVSKVDKGVSAALGSVSKSSQVTDSWYDTGVVIGDRAVLKAKAGERADAGGAIIITSKSRDDANSEVKGESIGVALNVNIMRGQNTIHDENNVDIGQYAKLETLKTEGLDKTGNIRVSVDVASEATAKTDMTGKSLLLEGTTVMARNTFTRNARISVGDYAAIRSAGQLRLHLDNGSSDAIITTALAESDGTFALGKADARTELNSNTELLVAKGVKITGDGVVRLQAKGGSTGKNNKPGIYTFASVSASGGGINPDVFSRTTLNIHNYVDVNREAKSDSEKDMVTIRSETGRVNLWATNESTHVNTDAHAYGEAAGGRSHAKSMTDMNLHNTVWVDRANLEAPKDEVLLEADNGDKNRAVIEMTPYAALLAAGGAVSADVEWSGTSFNQIRSDAPGLVTTVGSFVHNVYSPNDKNKGIIYKVSSSIGRLLITTLDLSERRGKVNYSTRCDFCGTGMAYDVAASKRANTGKPFEKALSPLVDIQRMLETLGITKARYGEEDYAAASKIFVLELPVMLEKDVTLNNEQIEKYRLWTNAVTQQDVYLLPNATRLYTRARGDRIMLQYVAEVIRGDVRGDGEIHEIDIITALTANAFRNPIIPVSSNGFLDFSTGTLTLPSRADFELYLHEVSGSWLIEKIEEGFIRRLDGDQAEINEAVLNGKELPAGVIVEGLTDGGERDSWKLYWLGDSPGTAKDPDQVLLGLLLNPETDEADAFRTSVSAIENGEDPVDVSLYLYRDSKSDRSEVEKYNCMFFDTPEGEKSLVKVVTDVLMGSVLEMPRSLEIVLRGFEIAGADFPAYSLTDHFFAMCDGTDGGVSMFDGFYTNTFDGDIFDSGYIRIEGIVDGNLNVILKEGQPIWPEWTGEDTAADIAGNEYVCAEDGWYPAEEAPEQELPENTAA